MVSLTIPHLPAPSLISSLLSSILPRFLSSLEIAALISRLLQPSRAFADPLPPSPLSLHAKVIGIGLFVGFADATHCAPKAPAIGVADVTMISSMASIGLTVALFISGEAFEQARIEDAHVAVAFYGLLWASMAFRGLPWPSLAFRGLPWPS